LHNDFRGLLQSCLLRSSVSVIPRSVMHLYTCDPIIFVCLLSCASAARLKGGSDMAGDKGRDEELLLPGAGLRRLAAWPAVLARPAAYDPEPRTDEASRTGKPPSWSVPELPNAFNPPSSQWQPNELKTTLLHHRADAPLAVVANAPQRGLATMLATRVAAYAAAACIALSSLATTGWLSAAALAAEPPSAEAQVALRRAFTSQRAGLLPAADSGFSESIKLWEDTGQPPDELAALYKQRGIVRQEQGRLEEALDDLSKAFSLVTEPGSKADPAEIQRTFVLRARVNAALGKWRAAEQDLSAAISRLGDLDAIEATNPYLYAERSSARSKLGDFAGASEDAVEAEVTFKAIGDKVRRLLSASDAALALYGAGEVDLAIEKMRFVFANKGIPASNNPDDIPLLQELSRKDAELHLAYAGHLYGALGRVKEAQAQWESGCIRIEAYVQDGEARQQEETTLRAEEERLSEQQAKVETLKSSTVKDNVLNNDFVARLNGLDPASPYVNQRPQRNYFWYKVGEAEVERRDAGNALAQIDPGLSCIKFRNKEWLKENRPEWPPQLVENVLKYAASNPQGLIVMPRKGSAPSQGEVDF